VKKGISESRKGRPTKYAKRKPAGAIGKMSNSKPALITTNV
jgi:sugar-specific transcriptional regulator TrmB